MPKLTLEEFVCNLHNWVQDNSLKSEGEGSIGVSRKSIPQYLALLEEWDEFLVNKEPRAMKVRRAVSAFCEKIANSKDVDVGFRARAAKFLISEPEPVVEAARVLVPWEAPRDDPENAWNAIPEDMREEAQRDLLEWAPEEGDDGEGDDGEGDDD